MSQNFFDTSWLLLLLLLLGSKQITIAQNLFQRNYSGLPDGAQQNLHSEASRLPIWAMALLLPKYRSLLTPREVTQRFGALATATKTNNRK